MERESRTTNFSKPQLIFKNILFSVLKVKITFGEHHDIKLLRSVDIQKKQSQGQYFMSYLMKSIVSVS
jgi:hypothetical protein